MFTGGDRNIDAKTEAKFFGGEQRHPAGDNASGLKLLDAFPAGRL